MKTNPDYAEYVRTIEWDFMSSRLDMPHYGYDRNWDTYNLLSRLINVTRVSISENHMENVLRIYFAQPSTLFPRGTCLRTCYSDEELSIERRHS